MPSILRSPPLNVPAIWDMRSPILGNISTTRSMPDLSGLFIAAHEQILADG